MKIRRVVGEAFVSALHGAVVASYPMLQSFANFDTWLLDDHAPRVWLSAFIVWILLIDLRILRLESFSHCLNMVKLIVHRHNMLLLILFCSFIAQTLQSTSTCYHPDGSVDPLPRLCPGIDSPMCCYLNRTDGIPDDTCTSQGLCISHDPNMKGEYFVDACTSKTWDSDSGCSPLWKACGG